MLETVFLFILSLTPLLWFTGSELMLGHDSGFRLNFSEHIKNLAYTWYPNANFGIDWSLYQGFIPIQAVETMASMVTGSLIWGEKIAFVCWFFAIGLSIYLFVRYFFDRTRFLPLYFVAPVFWMFNFYVLNGWSIGERAKFSLYLALPLVIVIFFKIMRREWSVGKGTIIFGLLFFFANGGGSPPLYGAILVTVVLLSLFFLLVDWRKNVIRIGMTVASFGLCFVLFNAYFVLPQVRLLTGNYASTVGDRGGIDGLIAWEREISKHASIPNILRFGGFPNWYNNPSHPYANIYLSNAIFSFLSFLPLATIIFGMVFWRHLIAVKDRQILFFLILLGVVGLFFTAGSHPPFGAAYTALMRHIPGFAIFRSSIYKFAPTVYLPLIIGFSYFLSLGVGKVTKKGWIATVWGLALSLSVVLYHFPYLTGNLFSIGDGFTTKLSVQTYVSEMSQYINAHTEQNDRILLVPPLDWGFINSPLDTYTWGYYSLDILPRIAVNRSFLANDSNDDSITSLLYRRLIEGDMQKFAQLARIAGVSHVLWRGDVRFSLGVEGDSLSRWRAALETGESMMPIYESGLWKLYALKEKPVPKIYISDMDTYVVGVTVNDAYLAERASPPKKETLLRLDERAKGEISETSPIWVEAECFYCKTNEYSKLIESIRLPPISDSMFLLGDRQRRKVDAIIPQVIGKPQEVDARLASAALSLSRDNNDEYVKEMESIFTIVSGLSGRDRDIYAARVYAYGAAHKRDKASVAHFLGTYLERMAPLVWKGEGRIYRFGANVPFSASYSLWTPNPYVYDVAVIVDGKEFRYGQPISLSAGYHRIEMQMKEMTLSADVLVSPVFLNHPGSGSIIYAPSSIHVKRVNPVRFDVEVTASVPYTIVFSERFNSQWRIRQDGLFMDYPHFEANGYANAWRIGKTGRYAFSIEYAPQRFVYIGGVISVVMFIGSVAYLIIQRRKIS